MEGLAFAPSVGTSSALAPLFFVLLDEVLVLFDLVFVEAAFFADRTLVFVRPFPVLLDEVLLDLVFAEAAFFALAPLFFVLFDEVLLDLVFAEAALLAAIWDFNTFTDDFAFASFFLVLDSCAFSFFFFICS